MLAELIPYVAATTFATAASAGCLALPAVLGVRGLLSRREIAPLARGPLERSAVLLACLAGALGAVACADAVGLAVDHRRASDCASILLCFVAPVPLGAVPWMAGEVLSGASHRQIRGLLAAIGAACAVSWTLYALCWKALAYPLPPWPAAVGIQYAGAALAALLAGSAYLRARGEPLAEVHPAAVALERV